MRNQVTWISIIANHSAIEHGEEVADDGTHRQLKSIKLRGVTNSPFPTPATIHFHSEEAEPDELLDGLLSAWRTCLLHSGSTDVDAPVPSTITGQGSFLSYKIEERLRFFACIVVSDEALRELMDFTLKSLQVPGAVLKWGFRVKGGLLCELEEREWSHYEILGWKVTVAARNPVAKEE